MKCLKKKFNNDENIASMKKGTSNAKNIIRVLKECLKIDALTDIETEKINKMITLLENGELPVRIIKEGNKKIKQITAINDFIKFSKEIENLIPKVYFDKEEKEEEKNREGRKLPKEIILSEYFI